MRIFVVADSDIDGLGASTILWWFYECRSGRLTRPSIEFTFPTREALNAMAENTFEMQRIADAYDRIYIFDTGVNSAKANENVGHFWAPKTVYIDHHETNADRQERFQGKYVGFHVVEGSRCTAKIAYDVLYRELALENPKKAEKFAKIKEFADLVNDIDMWVRDYPRSSELADFVEAVKDKQQAFGNLKQICLTPTKNTDFMVETLLRVNEEKMASISLARSTLVKHEGYKCPFYTAFVDGYQSEAAAEVVHPRGIVAVYNVRSGTLSLRLGKELSGMKFYKHGDNISCLEFAELFGGGGHPQAAGVSKREMTPILKAMSKALGVFMLEALQNDRRTA